MDQDLAARISQAWSQGKDASNALGLQVNGELALSRGNSQQAMHYFEAAEHELNVLRSSPVNVSSNSGY